MQRVILLGILVTLILLITFEKVNAAPAPVDVSSNTSKLQLWLTISARRRYLEVSWKNAPAKKDDLILLTKQEPYGFQKAKINNTKNSDNKNYWISNHGNNEIVLALPVTISEQWYTTGIHFDYELSRNITIHTKCYGYWASYIDADGNILSITCIRAYPNWMQEERSVVGGLRVRDLFIPGTHDSGSYKTNFDPLLQETPVTKYSLCQEEDIRGQLMHGARYLDIRPAYYRINPEKFFVNHGLTIQQPLRDVIAQVKEFVLETNEIVIFGLKEFPVGFKDIGVHRLLVHFLKEHFGDVIIHPSLTWRSTLQDVWGRKQNVFLAYDNREVVYENPDTLFDPVHQNWGNKQKWDQLEKYLRSVNENDKGRLSSRPVADMAELTPQTWDVIFDKLGGLRKMADDVNWRISSLYRDELGNTTNIVAADFIRGTTLMESAIEWNRRKVI